MTVLVFKVEGVCQSSLFCCFVLLLRIQMVGFWHNSGAFRGNLTTLPYSHWRRHKNEQIYRSKELSGGFLLKHCVVQTWPEPIASYPDQRAFSNPITAWRSQWPFVLFPFVRGSIASRSQKHGRTWRKDAARACSLNRSRHACHTYSFDKDYTKSPQPVLRLISYWIPSRRNRDPLHRWQKRINRSRTYFDW